MSDLKGINLAMQTPMNENGVIEYKRWEELIDCYIDAGVHGLVLGSGTGQHPYLTETECNKLYEIGAKRVDGRCNVICQTSALNFDDVMRRTKHAEGIGADALMILPPYLEGPADDDGLFEFYAEIDRSISTDVVGYNIPQATGISVSVPLFERLLTLDNFNYIKDSAGDLTTHQAYLQAGGKVLNGCDTTTLFALMAGAEGAIWGGANYMPHEAVKLYELTASGDYKSALELWSCMIPSLLYIWNGDYIPAVKSACRMRGFDGGNVRKPVRPLAEAMENELAATLAPLDAWATT
ncbi:MAG: dihydrodipicolinate synthase family protein [Gammaproteobacteria bacterium]|nr:MAG: dihydrodipicolinate synthase family protein [Gammaproteobacteria bacterium]